MHIHCLRFSLIPYRLLSSLFLFCSLPSSTFLLCVPSARCAHCLSLSLAFSPFPPALRRCISSADESGGSETEYGIAEGGRPIERARGMQSERSRCCHVTERARARAARRERANAWTTIFPNRCPGTTFFLFFFLSFFFLLFFAASCCLSHASYPRLRRVRRLFITRVPRERVRTFVVACKRQRVPSSVCFRECLRGQGKKRPFPFRDVVFIWYPRNSNEDHLTRARARCAKSESRIEALSNGWPDK